MQTKPKLEFRPLEDNLSILRYSPGTAVPEELWHANFLSVTKCVDELSIVISGEITIDKIEALLGSPRKQSLNWSGLMVVGPLSHDMIGIMAEISRVLAAAHCSIFALSTYDTDYILVPSDKRELALDALSKDGHKILV